MMKLLKIVSAIVLLCIGQLVWGQTRTGAEYFFDADPGIGKATPLDFSLKDSIAEAVLEIQTTGLNAGFHKIGIRTRDDAGVWSMAIARNFFVQPKPAEQAEPAMIVGGEYFVDKDPGLGNSIPFSLDRSSNVDSQLSVVTKGIAAGFHKIGMRVKDAEGKWSHTFGQNCYVYKPQPDMPPSPRIVAGEYFFDDDPGFGNALPFEVKDPSDLILPVVVDLPAGFHKLSVRMKDSLNIWSHSYSQSFYIFPKIEQPVSAELVALEYEISDGTDVLMIGRLDYEPNMVIEQDFVIPVQKLTAGSYLVRYRAIDKTGLAGMFMAHSFDVVDYGLSSFYFPGKQIDSTHNFNLTDKTVYVEIDPLTDVTALTPFFELTAGASLFYEGKPLVSGQTAIDFTFPVSLTAVNSAGDEHVWTVEVYQRQLGAEKDITSLSFEVAGGSNYSAYLVDQTAFVADYNSHLDLTGITLHFELSDLAELSYNGVVYQSGQLVLDLTEPVELVVTAENGTEKVWSFSLNLFDDERVSKYMYLYNKANGYYETAYDMMMNQGLMPEDADVQKDIEILAPLSGQQNEFDFVTDVSAPNSSTFAKIGSIDGESINSFALAESAFQASVETEKLSGLDVGDYFIVKLREGMAYAVVHVNYVNKTIDNDSDYIDFYYTKYYKTEDNCAGFYIELNSVDGGLQADVFGGSGNYNYYLDEKLIADSNGFFEGIVSGGHSVSVEDVDLACSDIKTIQLTELYADFEPDLSSGNAPLEVYFNNYSSENATEFYWDFNGDGIDDSNEQNPVHIYEEQGIYNVRLTVSDGVDVDQVYRTINVYDEPPCDYFGVQLYSDQDILYADIWQGSGDYTVYLDGEEFPAFDYSFGSIPYGYHYVEVYDNVSGCYADDDYVMENPAEFFSYVMSIVDEFLIEIEENKLVEDDVVSLFNYQQMVSLSKAGDMLMQQADPDTEQMQIVMDDIGDILNAMSADPKMVMVTSVRLGTHVLKMSAFDEPVAIKEYIEPENASLKTTYWMSSDASVAEVFDGYVYANGIGEAVVYSYAVMSDDVYDSCIVQVVPELAYLGIPKASVMTLDETLEIPVSMVPNGFPAQLLWASSDTSVATVKDGMVFPKKLGTVNIMVKDLLSGKGSVSMLTIVSEIAPLSAIKLDPDSVRLKIGESFGFSVSPVPANSRFSRLTAKLSDPDVVKLGKEGVIVAMAKGQTDITVTDSATGISAKTVVFVDASAPPKVREDLVYMLQKGESPLVLDVGDLVTDDNTPLVSLKYELLPLQNLAVTAENMQLKIAALDDAWTGDESVQIIIEDKDGNKTLLEILVVISDQTNLAPVIAEIYQQKMMVGAGFMPVDLSAFVSDDYSMFSELTLSSVNGDNLTAEIVDGILHVLPASSEWIGEDSIKLIATDPQGASSSRFVKYTVSDVDNTAPWFAETELVVDLIDGEIVVDLTPLVSDDYTLPMDIMWSALGNNKLNVDLDGGRASVSVVDDNWAGSELVTFVATDSYGKSAYLHMTFMQEKPMDNTWTAKPAVDFTANRTSIGAGTSLDFFGSITGGDADSWRWEFESGVADDIYSLNPKVTFNKPGKYSVKLKAENSNGEDSLVKSEYISVYGIDSPDTVICEGESIDLVAIADGADEITWSTGASTNTVTIVPVSDTVIYIAIKKGLVDYLDTVEIGFSKNVEFGPDFEICENSGAVLSAPGYVNYQWSDGTTGLIDQIALPDVGTYGVTVTDGYGCTSSDEVSVTAVNSLPVFSLGDDQNICLGSVAVLGIPEVSGYSYMWNNGMQTASIEVADDGVYSGTVTDANGCMYSDDVEVLVYRPYAEQIGLVTASEDGPGVLVAWERTRNKRTSYYKIMRESTVLDVYDSVGMVPFDSVSVFEDFGANAKQQSFKYKIVSVDSCGNEVESQFHQTIHLFTSYSATDNSITVEWTPYKGFEFSSYKVFRGTTTENLQEVRQVPSDRISYTDLDPVEGMKYRVVVVLPNDVDPLQLKTDTGPFSQSISNIAEVELEVGISISDVNFGFAPNPTVDNRTVLMADGLVGNADLQLYSTNSTISMQMKISQARTELDLTDLPDGFYIAVINYKGQQVAMDLIVK